LFRSLAPQQAEYARTIRGAGDALLGVINDILDFSKAEAGGMTLEVTDFDPRALAEDAVALFTGKAKEKGLALAARVDPKVPSRLRGDVGRLRQILSNLVGNAVKFTDHGSVTVEARLLDEAEARARVRFEVRDTGIGISPEGRERLFKAFTQADASTTRKYGGTGLGLAISKKLVEAMGGDIGVDAEPGRGSTFWLEVSLPVGAAADPASEAKARRSVPPPVGAWGRSKILVAEDNPINQRVVLLQLGQLGCRADVVADGREAVAATAAIPYDIVFMDCQMPEMDGFEATAQIRRREERLGRRTVIVAMTANAMEGDRERCLAAGMDDYVPKPVRPEALAEAVRRWYKPVDAAAVAGLLALGDGAMFRELTEQFLGDAERRAAELGKSAAAGDFEAVRLTAHTLKGSSGTMGARGVQDLCGQLEAAAAAKDLSGAPKLLAVLAGELAAVADALRSAAAKA
ncbi:response regulator, partial [bacterium]